MNKLRKSLSFVLAIALVLGLCQMPVTETKAASKSVSMDSLGSHGSITIGKKKKSGSWWSMKVDGEKAFCLDLGYTCHNGDSYELSTTGTYSSASGGENGLKACIGYWYDYIMKGSNKAYIFAQALLWSIEENKASESDLKDVIKTIKQNTGYYSSKKVDDLYSQIFSPSGTVTATYKEWTYGGASSKRQKLLYMYANGIKIIPHSMNTNTNYRQKIQINKKDEDGNPVKGVRFSVEALNLDELYYYKVNDTGSSDSDEEIPDFTITEETDANGQLSIRFAYRIQTQTYYYYTDAELDAMDDTAKAKAEAEMESAGQKHGGGMTETEARKLMETELDSLTKSVKNQYIIKEVSTGNANLLLNPEYAAGVTITLDEKDTNFNYGTGVITDTQVREIDVVDKYKKASVKVKKNVSNTDDGTAHGNANCDGAIYQLYEDAACTQIATVLDKDTKEAKKAKEYVVKNGEFETDYLRCDKTYYLKETYAPKGLFVSDDITKITVDANQLTQEYTQNYKVVNVSEVEKKGYLEIYKFTTDGSTGPATFEEGATFEVTLKGKTYNECKEDERATLVMNKDGYAKTTQPLAYGIYQIHQTSTGKYDTEKIADEEIEIGMDIQSVALNNKTYTRLYNNKPFSAHLRIVKKSKNTEKTVLKANTKYQIFQVLEDGTEKRVEQTFFNGNNMIKIGTDDFPFVTDDTGVILTAKGLSSGTYRVYEIDSAEGLHITTKYIQFVVDSKADNYKVEMDADGNSFATITLDYVNEDTYGKLKIKKVGEQLSGWDESTQRFIWEKTQLKGVIFDIYADGNIETQDGQGTNWYNDGDLVATVTTGEGAVFSSECSGITGAELEEDGTVTVNLPLGKYTVKERKTLYGYLLSDKTWPVEFNWKNKEEEFVFDSTESTDDNGLLTVQNERAKTRLEVVKTDKDSKKPVKDVQFGIYTKHNIYNADGKCIVKANTRLGGVKTDEKGQAVSDMDLPLMSNGYGKNTDTGVASGGAVTGTAISDETVTGSAIDIETDTKNSGDYYLREESVDGSYYLDSSELPVHLEYKDAVTPLIEKKVEHTNKQTEVEIDKTSVTGSDELDGCQLEITDEQGNVIASWTSGQAENVTLNQDLGYYDLNSKVVDKHLVLKGLYQNKVYILTEKRPADGYVTADSIAFKLQESSTEKGKTLVSIKENENFILQDEYVVRMIDHTTAVQFKKTDEKGKLLGEAKIAVYDSAGNKVMEFLTKKGEAKIFTGELKVGETYTFKELETPEGFETAKDITYTIMDQKELQTITMVDAKLGIIQTKVPKNFHENQKDNTKKSPKTGYLEWFFMLLAGMLTSGGIGMFVWRKQYAKKKC